MLNQFSRTELLLGKSAMERLAKCRVAVFGIGGVGGYVCEALARSGVGTFDLIDDDKICLTNINRQIIATRKTVGQYKADVMKERILEINPSAQVNIYKCFFLPENASDFPFEQYDYVIDAIDTVTAKIELVLQCQKTGTHIRTIGRMNNLTSEPTKTQLRKYNDLISTIKDFGSVAVAFSGGVDSTFLLYAAKEALGDCVIAVTAQSCSFPQRELNEAKAFCESHKIRHYICESEELDIEGFSHNPKNRCYLCKHELFEKIQTIAARESIAEIAEGSNLDDNGDYRPGLQAVAELGIQSPLRSVGFTKEDIRALSKYLGLPTWNKQSFACLSSRFVYGETISREKLGMVDQAEQLLLDLGFRQVRVRIHGSMARIEILPDEFAKLIHEEVRNRITSSFKSFGFTYVTMDLMGYRTGSMNEVLDK